ncbi:dihydrolipoamide dehydrogenase [Brevibacillus panacihumi W25]|uniref:Dihydrolipoyl dehydrogenase n=1 Tax=Brevibacillus panacihumi W25 TaxID=1408254 RepID=V6M6U0_9BACL|nr:dihydrolipoyl dehydrogenase [Brevibacillus panacihumi]EST54269.1 dihydrolipoamide dehydrogenase [Brevibacillus panacihumi W25]
MKKRVLVIGGGPGGYTAAIRASQLGGKVTLIEKDFLGGTCLNAGCIPTKSLLDSSGTWAKSRTLFPQHLQGEVPWKEIMARKNQAVQHLRMGVEGLLREGQIDVISGTASFTSERKVIVDGDKSKMFDADAIIIAAGSRPVRPAAPWSHIPGVITSDELLTIDRLPGSLAIIGGGVIGIEFATIFAELGVQVHVVEAAQRIVPTIDVSISSGIQANLKSLGVQFTIGSTVETIAKEGDGTFTVSLSQGETFAAELVLLAMGRKANLQPLRLDDADIQVEGGKIKVNAWQQTNHRDIYAVGDCASPVMLAHVAMMEGKLAAERAMGNPVKPIAYDLVPHCLYSHPEAAIVGLTFEEATKRGFEAEEAIFPLSASGRALVEGESQGMIKVVANKKYGQILGLHLLAPHATEFISQAALALSLEATADEVLAMIFPHPTISEGIQEAVAAIGGTAIHLPGKLGRGT